MTEQIKKEFEEADESRRKELVLRADILDQIDGLRWNPDATLSASYKFGFTVAQRACYDIVCEVPAAHPKEEPYSYREALQKLGEEWRALNTPAFQSAIDDADAILIASAHAADQTPAPQEGWIAVSERLPDEGRAVLIAVEGWVTMGWRHDGPSTRWTDWDGVELIFPTHWRDLPAPPTQTGEK